MGKVPEKEMKGFPRFSRDWVWGHSHRLLYLLLPVGGTQLQASVITVTPSVPPELTQY